MTLQTENGGPSFYTFSNFRLGKSTLVYGGLLSIIAFLGVTFMFNYGISEQLWTFKTVPQDTILPSSAEAPDTPSSTTTQSRPMIVRVSLPDSVLRSLSGTYFSERARREYSITLERGQLYLRIDSQEVIELIPVSDHSLYVNQERYIEFAANPKGKVDRLDIFDKGRHIVAFRKIGWFKETPPQPIRVQSPSKS